MEYLVCGCFQDQYCHSNGGRGHIRTPIRPLGHHPPLSQHQLWVRSALRGFYTPHFSSPNWKHISFHFIFVWGLHRTIYLLRWWEEWLKRVKGLKPKKWGSNLRWSSSRKWESFQNPSRELRSDPLQGICQPQAKFQFQCQRSRTTCRLTSTWVKSIHLNAFYPPLIGKFFDVC